ncbi:MAG: type I-MYXAN CRISPR-associated protein Cas6/Cmx6 [Nostoc sp.]|uniref:type I-MYXAN CRISPR-associated protein Cas6/Cmx6 n=1 Tax=Nostoc sp. TaxID=1180 RepID=UPI002FFB05CD
MVQQDMVKEMSSYFSLPTQTPITETLTQTYPKETLMPKLPWVELRFSIIGQTIPVDHGYGLYSAIAHFQSQVHDMDTLGIHTIAGIPSEDGQIHLTDNSRLQIRLPVDKISLIYPLAGKSLKIGKHTIRLGIPEIYLLEPAERLRSRIVIIQGYQEPESFLAAAQRQLEQLAIQGKAFITKNTDGSPKRRSIKIKRFTVVGFGLEIINLNNEDSLTLLRYGIGGKRKMGCGVFVPVKIKGNAS